MPKNRKRLWMVKFEEGDEGMNVYIRWLAGIMLDETVGYKAFKELKKEMKR